MDSYVEIAIVNALIVVPLAVLAELAGRLLRRPALTHILWVLILVKLLTPPVFQIPLIDRDWLSSSIHRLLPPVLKDVDRFDFGPRHARVLDEAQTTARPKPRPRTLAEQEKRPLIRQVSPLAALIRWVRGESFRQLTLSILQVTWALGALIWFGIQGFRCVRFRMSLTRGTPAAPELQQLADQMASRLGLPQSPTVWLMPGVMSPMLWGNCHSTLLIFPEDLLDRLTPDATGTLLTHELAHFRRKDHWVRIIALMATGFFWWHPVVWWARREIEAVEEECCDALVLKAAAAPPKCYAEAILETVDFLAEAQLRLPPLATGLGQVPFLRQRLTWIMRGPRRQELGHCGRALCLIWLCTLPLQPTWLSTVRASTIAPLPVPSSPNTPPSLDSAPIPSSVPKIVSPTEQLPDQVATQLPTTSEPAKPSNITSRWSGFEVRSHSSDGRFVVMGNKSEVYVLDLESGRDFDLSDFLVTAMAFAPESHRFATVGRDRFLRLWNAETCEVDNAWQIPGGTVKTVDLSPDGSWIVTGGRDGIIRIWNANSPQPVRELPSEGEPINCVRFSPSFELLAIATGDWMSPQSGRIALFDVGSWNERISMNWNSPTAAIAFRSDGESLTSGDWQGRIARWSISTGELLGLANGHKDAMAIAEFSPNESLLAEIPVPDLPVNALWEEPEPRDEFRWFFNSWPGSLKSPARVPASPNPASPARR